jgi:hypothetical protein
MPTNSDGNLRAIWQSQLTNAQPMTSEQLRSRAKQFESKARRSVRLNQLSAGLAGLGFAFGLFTLDGGLLVKVGAAMLLIMSVYMVWGLSYFFSALQVPTDASAGTCAAVHKRQLERQRDMNLSARSAGPLLLPAVILFALGRHWPNAETYVGPEEWGLTVALVASFYFLMQLGFTYTDLLAHRLQREIDQLEAMMKDAPW